MPPRASTEEPAAPAPTPAPAPAKAPAAAPAVQAAARAAPRRPASTPAPAPAPAPTGPTPEERTYLEAIGRVAELRRMGQTGAVTQPAPPVEFARKPNVTTTYPSMQPMTIPAARRPVPMGASPSQRGPMVVSPTQAPTPLTSEELRTQSQSELAQRAMKAGKQFSEAIGEYKKRGRTLEALVQSPTMSKATFPALAADQRKRLEAVLSLAAQMREYGFVGSNEDLMTQFAPK